MRLKTKSMTWAVALTVALTISVLWPSAGWTQDSTSTQFTLKRIPASAVHHGQQPPRIRNKNGTSSNWSGYAVYPLAQTSSVTALTIGKGNGKGNKPAPTPLTFTDVKGSWTVPEVVESDSANTYSSTWVGLDGYANNTVEQIGIEQDCANGSPQYYAWFEMYPKWAYMIVGFPVNPGDTITAEVAYTSKGNFTLTITNNSSTDGDGNPVTFSITQRAPSAQRLSAEWIEEAPWSGGVLPLADFDTVNFFECSATTSNGHTGPINDSAWQYDEIIMETSEGTYKAYPNSFDGTNFSVVWEHE